MQRNICMVVCFLIGNVQSMKLFFSITAIILLSGTSLWGQENRVALFSGNPEERVQPFDTLIYEDMTSMVLKIANVGDFEKYDKLRLILTCELRNGGRKALKPKKYYAQHEITWNHASVKNTDSIKVVVFDENGHSDFDEKMKRKFKNFSISPTRRRWLEYWAAYQYQFELYGFQKSNKGKSISDHGNFSEEQYIQDEILGRSSTFYVRSLRRKRPRVGALLILR